MNEATDCELHTGFKNNFVNDNCCNSVKFRARITITLLITGQKHSATMSLIGSPIKLTGYNYGLAYVPMGTWVMNVK